QEMLSALTRYKRIFGHCNVPFQWLKNRRLGIWVANQRRLRERGRLSREQIERLDKLGLIWNPRNAACEHWFEKLAEYKAKHGDCNVPDKWLENASLGTWVGSLRGQKRTNTLPFDRVRRLEQIGFEWTPYDLSWERQFRALVEYKEHFGDCDVPAKWATNNAL